MILQDNLVFFKKKEELYFPFYCLWRYFHRSLFSITKNELRTKEYRDIQPEGHSLVLPSFAHLSSLTRNNLYNMKRS